MNTNQSDHGVACHARTFPMRCKYCGDSVYYLTCDHGLKILFDQLGAPWPEHGCTGYLKAVSVDDAIVLAPAKPRPTRAAVGNKIDKGYADKLLQARGKPHGAEIVRTEPYKGATVQEEGIIREIIPSVDIHNKFKVSPDSIAATQLGELGKGTFDQITIHTGALAGQDHFSYTYF
ncbi:MAG: hypothetical protein WCF84_22955, partial [Anaerolineae bacterium]